MGAISGIRNVGISAHIDSGKTTLSERILFYCGRIHRMQEVRGGQDGATMDHMALEKERGITITAAATTVNWRGHQINLIDTPGHVDFTIEVERSLRVLDAGILVLCGVAGVQSQSLTVDRQMKRYGVPRIAFINKLDRVGADPARVISEIESKLSLTAVPLQLPIRLEAEHVGVVDLVSMEAVTFEGANGENVRRGEIPEALREAAERGRTGMLDALSLFDDSLMEMLLEGNNPTAEEIRPIIRRLTIGRDIVPVLMGSAYRNKGVQPLLDGVVDYLSSPTDRMYFVRDNENDGAETTISADPDAPTVVMAFKIVDESFGQLTFTRVYQGMLRKGDSYFNPRSGKTQRVGRMVRMHADDREDVSEAGPGDIVALIAIDCASGDTLCDASKSYSLESIHVPEPVISLAVAPLRNADREKLTKALARFVREDPTFHAGTDAESNETVISGMGELHLEIYIERIKREYGCEVEVGAPKVKYREAPTAESSFDYKHRKQTGGSGQYGHVAGRMIPLGADAEEDYEFENKIRGGHIPTEYISSCNKGFRSARAKGPLAGYEVIGVKIVLEDGSSHSVDSSDVAFQIAAREAFKQALLRARPAILEPIMNVEVEVPNEFQGPVIGDLTSRRGAVTATDPRGPATFVTVDVPLAEMFGYATVLRSMTQGRATFSMEFSRYDRAPRSVQEDVIARAREKAAARG